jgi:hypothetical protein
MEQFTVEYSEAEGGTVLQSDILKARTIADAKRVAKKAFANPQINLGAQHYRILDKDGAIVALGSESGS